jgi:glycerate 2-kinase
VDRPPPSELTPATRTDLTRSLPQLKSDLQQIVRAALDAVDAGLLVRRAMVDPSVAAALNDASAVHVAAAGKAASVMLDACAGYGVAARAMLGIGPAGSPAPPPGTEWHTGGHPLPTEGSLAGARRALAVARQVRGDELLLVLLSGGGSALMALPAEGVTLVDKQQTVRQLLEGGADIHELNTVRKHLSAIKGGLLAAACPGRTLTLAVSDVVGDDLSVIASGPTVADPSSYADALAVLARRGGESTFPASVVGRLRAGAAGAVRETPDGGDARLARATAHVIGPQRGAVEGARQAAAALGFAVRVVETPVTGEARDVAGRHFDDVARLVDGLSRPACVIAAGETTVTVTGGGKGGRNQEFTFAAARALTRLGGTAVVASVGTDGIDGPTDAAGAIGDTTTFERARTAGIEDPGAYLRDNNTYAFFDRLGDLIRTGPTRTNVGDIQIVLVG